MSKLWKTVLNKFEEIGSMSGCHQIPERCLVFRGYRFPICSRCTGVIVGEILFIILTFCNIHINLLFAFFLLLIMFLDWAIQYVHILESNNIRRLITGILGGYGLLTFYYYVLKYILCYFKIYI